MSKERVLAIGASGFIGAAVAKRALDFGWEVLGVSRSLAGDHLFPGEPCDATSTTALKAVFDRFQATVVVVSLSQFTPRTEREVSAPSLLAEVQALAAIAVCCEGSSVRQVVYLSSAGSVYGDTAGPSAETTPLAPRSVYGRMKVACETLATAAFAAAGIPLAILRVSNPYGPGQDPERPQGVIAVFMNRLMQHRPLEIFGQSRKDYVYIDDVADAVIEAVRHKAAGVFNIGSGDSTSLEELVELLSRTSASNVVANRHEALTHDVQIVALNVDRAYETFGWRATTSLESGLSRTFAWLQQRSKR